MGGVVAGWPEEIARARAPRTWPPVDISLAATAFWALCFGAVLAGPLKIYFDLRAEYESDARQSMRQHALSLAPFAETMRAECQKVYDALGGSEPDAAIRSVLQSLANLAWLLDHKPNARYAANVMLFVSADKATAEQKNGARFWDGSDDDMRGLLYLSLNLSSIGGGTAERDPKLKVFALPIPKETKRKLWPCGLRERHRVLPGAPRAFVTRTADYQADSTDMATWCRGHGAFSLDVAKELREYMASPAGLMARSLIAIALVESGQTEPVGVLNVHREVPDILGRAPDAFVSLTQSLQDLLLKALRNLPR